MEQFLSTTSWVLLLEVILILGLVYLGLRSFSLLVEVTGKGQVRSPRAIRVLRRVWVVYEIVAVCVVTVLFVTIDLFIHGLIVLLLGVLLWRQLGDFFAGRFHQLQTDIQTGQRIASGGREATVQRVGALGVVLQFPGGTRYVPYGQLYREGVTRISGAHTRNFLDLNLTARDATHAGALSGRLLACPYLDWGHHPEVHHQAGSEPAEVRLRVLLLDEDYVQGFTALLVEWGFTATVRS